MAYLRDRRAFGNIGTRRFRGARFGDPLSPRFTGLLDQYGGAAAAYSLRALSSGWLAGDVVEVRRSSDSTTQDFTASQITNGDLVAFCGAGDGFVSTWYDQSGNANDAVQATTTSQPKIVDAGVLVAGGIDFDGVDDFLNISTPTVLGVEFYEVMVSKPVSASSQTNAAFISPNAAGGGERSYINTSTNSLSIRNNSTNIPSTLSLNQTAQQLIAFSSTAADFTFVLDGADDVKLALISPMIAGTIAGGAGSLAGTFSEVILYASDQSANRAAIEANINDFYSIY